VFFQKDHTFVLSLADGTPVGGPSAPGTVISAGTYRVNVDDTAEAVMQFHLTSPGVELDKAEEALTEFGRTFWATETEAAERRSLVATLIDAQGVVVAVKPREPFVRYFKAADELAQRRGRNQRGH
jgi:hypothetical protein